MGPAGRDSAGAERVNSDIKHNQSPANYDRIIRPQFGTFYDLNLVGNIEPVEGEFALLQFAFCDKFQIPTSIVSVRARDAFGIGGGQSFITGITSIQRGAADIGDAGGGALAGSVTKPGFQDIAVVIIHHAVGWKMSRGSAHGGVIDGD